MNDIGSVLERADALLQLSRPAEALALLETATDTWSEEPDLYAHLGVALLQCGRTTESLVAAERALELEPENEWAHRIRSVALENLARIDEAEQAARAAIRVAPNSWYPYDQLASVLSNQPDRLKEAESVARKSLELAPEESGPHIRLARLAAKDWKWAEAESFLRAALRIDPHELDALQMLGRVQGKQSKLDEALDSFHTVLRADPSRRSTQRHLMDMLWRRITNVSIIQLIIIVMLSPLSPALPAWIYAPLGAAGVLVLYALPFDIQRRFRKIPGYLRTMFRAYPSLLITVLISLVVNVFLTGWWFGLLLSNPWAPYPLHGAAAIAFANLLAIRLSKWYSKDEQKGKLSHPISATPVTVWGRTIGLGLFAAMLPLWVLTTLSAWSHQGWFTLIAILLSAIQVLVGGRINLDKTPLQILLSRWRSPQFWLLPPILVYITLLLCAATVPVWTMAALVWSIKTDLLAAALMISVTLTGLAFIAFCIYRFANRKAGHLNGSAASSE